MSLLLKKIEILKINNKTPQDINQGRLSVEEKVT